MVLLRSGLFGIGGLLLALSLVLFGGGISSAQDATPPDATAPHPVHVHEGTCDNLDPAPLFPLNDVTSPDPADAVQSSGGAPVAVETSTTTIDATLADLAGGERAINVHESADNIGNYIACGDIGGAIVPGADADQSTHLAIGLRELNDSGYAGVAVLREVDTQTEVTIYLAQGLAGDATGSESDSADHASHGDASAGIAVDIKDFAYSPDPVTVAVGDRITWTNQDSAPHTATAQDREALQSGTLNQGYIYTETFEVAGTYEYVCEFHPNMAGTVIVQ